MRTFLALPIDENLKEDISKKSIISEKIYLRKLNGLKKKIYILQFFSLERLKKSNQLRL